MNNLLAIDDDEIIHEVLRDVFPEPDFHLNSAMCADEGIKMLASSGADAVLLDVNLPDQSGLGAFKRIQEIDPTVPVIFVTASDASEPAIEAMKLGAFDYLFKPLEVGELNSLVERALEVRRLMSVSVEIGDAEADTNVDSLIGNCAAMREVYKAIGRIAPRDATVLIRGETGTGKELVARAIYQHSLRYGKPFMAINCAAIPEALLESELFGHAKGAFTGADRERIGKFEQCSGGTLFLDEIGDMPPLLQGKILRVLQEGEFQRVGGNKTIKTDVRIIAATHRDLDQLIEEREFRADLFYRLNTFSIDVPPLRDREDDVTLLIDHFVQRFGKDLNTSIRFIEPEAREVLLSAPWPGNVRELQGVLKQAIVQAPGHILTKSDLPEHLWSRRERPLPADSESGSTEQTLEAYLDELMEAGQQEVYAKAIEWLERIVIPYVLKSTDGHQTKAAQILGMTRGSLRNKLRTLGISVDRVLRERTSDMH